MFWTQLFSQTFIFPSRFYVIAIVSWHHAGKLVLLMCTILS